MQWDEVVDVICTGSGAGGLASAIVADSAGQVVFVADANGDDRRPDSQLLPSPWSETNGLQHELGLDVVDPETNEYLQALTTDLGPLSRFVRDVDVPLGVVDDPSPVGYRRRGRSVVDPFIGARLKDWAARCVASPYGVLYNRVTDRNMSPMRSGAGETIEAAVVGFIETGPELSGTALTDWLSTQARDRGIDVHTACPLQRLVFEDGQVLGAVVATTEGSYAVRARRGVIVATGGHQLNSMDATLLNLSVEDRSTVQVCVVSRPASRFGRVELLTKEPLARESVTAGAQWAATQHI
jgi:hypothetical protein